MVQSIFDYFLGSIPDYTIHPVAYNIYYTARIIMGIFIFAIILELLRMLRRVF